MHSTALFAQDKDTLYNATTSNLIAPKYTKASQWGYILGHNHEYRQQYAEKYYVSGSVNIVGVVAHFEGKFANPQNVLEIAAFKVGTNKLPSSKRAAKDIPYKDLKLDGSPMTILFNTKPTMTDSFYVSANFYDYAHGGYEGDTIGLMCTEAGSRVASDLSNFGRNVVQRHSHEKVDWRDFYTQNFTPMAVHFALFPIIQYNNTTGTDDAFAHQTGLKMFAPYPNPCTGNINLSFDLAAPSPIEVQLMNSQGQFIKNYDFGQKSIGNHTLNLDLEIQPAGMYVLLLKTNQTAIATTLTIE